MSLRRITAADALARLPDFSAVIDARSESEYALDRLPGALNWPSLHDAERHSVGLEYKQVSPFAARKRGAALVARNIAGHIEAHVGGLERDWRPLVYCWRGGQRSGALSAVLDQIGFSVHVLEGGYQAFRRAVTEELDTLPGALRWRVVCGRTGSGKSRLLQALQQQGAQVLDLEALACHRGSVLGPVPGMPQPSQKGFDTAVWAVLRGFDSARSVYVEGESRTIGRLRIPEPLLQALRAAPVVQIEMPLAGRVALLVEDYAHFIDAPETFCERLNALVEVRGKATVANWQAAARAGRFDSVVRELLELHYDPVYLRSLQRNFPGLQSALALPLADGCSETLATAARVLLRADTGSAGV